MPEIEPIGINPLQKYFRQPKVYLDLPSKGNFYPNGTIELTDTGELAIFPMTARDELMMKTPDALLNGEATAELIKSCVPSIKDPWAIPSIDIDALLIAIRIASYGENLEITTKVPGIGEERTFTIDLRLILNKLTNVTFDDSIEFGNMFVKIKPLSYREFTNSSLKTYEEQRIFQLATNDSVPEAERLQKFNESFRKLTDLTVSMLVDSIKSISVEGNEVTNKLHIQEFIDNADQAFYKTILDHIESQRSKFNIEPLQVKSSDDDIEKGAPEQYEIPITFDQAHFFE